MLHYQPYLIMQDVTPIVLTCACGYQGRCACGHQGDKYVHVGTKGTILMCTCGHQGDNIMYMWAPRGQICTYGHQGYNYTYEH